MMENVLYLFGTRFARCGTMETTSARNGLPTTPWTPVNVWEFEYPWLEYRPLRRRLIAGSLLLVSLGLAAHVYRAELSSYWAASLDAYPQLHAAWSELELAWTHSQALLARALDLYS